MEHTIQTAVLTRSVLLSEKTKHLEFAVEDSERFDFVAGQFISIREPRGDGKFITRAYSVASSPRGDNTFDLCLNRVENGFMSNYLCDLQEGDKAHFHGPHGLFVLKPHVRDVLLIATGTGVAPFRGMVEYLFSTSNSPEARHQGRHVWLVYGTRYPDDLYYREEFQRIAADNPNFHYVATLSRAPESWSGNRGYVQERVKEIVGNRKDMDAYICGLNDMVSSVRSLLRDECGWERSQIIYERYD